MKNFVPKQFAWLNNDTDEVEWFNNDSNYTEEQCLIMADVISKDFKEVDSTYDHETFLKEFFNYDKIQVLR